MDRVLSTEHYAEIYKLEKEEKEIKRQNREIKARKQKIKEEYDQKIKDKEAEYKEKKENFDLLMNEFEYGNKSKEVKQKRANKSKKTKQ